MRKGTVKTLHIGIVAALIVVGFAVISHVRGQVPEVGIAQAHVGDMMLRIAASGLVEGESADLSFGGAGRITHIYVEEGDSVSRTDLLARLVSVGGAPLTGHSDVIQAPYDGSIVTIYRRVGAVVQPGEPVVRVVSHEAPWVTAFVESEDAIHVRPGQVLKCRVGGYLSRPWELKVVQIGSEAVTRPDLPGSSRQVRVRCIPANPGFAVPVGTEVDIDGEIPLFTEAVLIPTAAIVQRGVKDTVWVVDDEKVTQRAVAVGANNFDLIVVRQGLDPGEVVVVEGKELLAEGMRVRTREMPPMIEPQEGG